MLDIDWSQLNKVLVDKFDRVNGIFAINKPAGITSHDLVDLVRHKLGTRKVGHAGALDPFATGIMIILVGKFTKKSEMLMKLDKTYNANVLIGVDTDSGDIDGKVNHINKDFQLDEIILKQKICNLNKHYNQYVPIYSSVKVNGIKLREAARSSSSFRLTEAKPKTAIFKLLSTANHKIKSKSINNILTLEIPSKEVIVDIRRKGVKQVKPSTLDIGIFSQIQDKFYSLEIDVDCSKGTYIRQLAVDLGKLLGSYGVLWSLTRTRLGDIELKDTIDIDQLIF